MKTVLVTGAAGYIGSVLSEHLLAAGHRVLALDSLYFGPARLEHLAHSPRFEFVRGDARDRATVEPLLRRADVVVPLAALVGAPLCAQDPVLATQINFEAVRLVNELRSRQQLVIYPNTNSGYGASSGEVYCTEETPLEPISHYGRVKTDAELMLLDSPNVVTFRLATVFGMSPRMRLDLLVNHFTWAAWSDGYIVIFEKDFKRNYVHIRDVADGFMHAMENAEQMSGRPYNLGLDDANLSKAELAETIKRYIPRFFIHYAEVGQDPDKRNYIVSNQRLREAGFVARRSLDDGIQELIKGFAMFGRKPLANI